MAERPKLSIRLGDRDGRSTADVLRAAIEGKTLVRAVYNRTRILLAPHVFYTEPGGDYVDGVVVERDGKAPREPKVGRFKTTGLTQLAATSTRFQPEPIFDPTIPRYQGGTIVTDGPPIKAPD